jgi:hypothetical protein
MYELNMMTGLGKINGGKIERNITGYNQLYELDDMISSLFLNGKCIHLFL